MADKMDKGKKRKRQTDCSSKPSKRIAIDEDKEVYFSHHQGGKWAPVIASTPGVAIDTSIPLQTYTKPRRNAPQRPGASGGIALKELLLHSSEHPKLDYTAREEGSGGSDSLLKHYVGVYDPETGKMEVMEARKMVVRGSVRAHQATKEDEISTNMRELRNTLGQTFGTKKAKKAIASVTENAISPDKATRKANGNTKLDSASAVMLANMAEATAGMSTREQLAASVDAAKARPKADTSATDIKDVYTIDSLVGIETMKLIPAREWQEAAKNKKDVQVTARYVARRINKCAQNADKLKLLRYILLLIDIHGSLKGTRGPKMLPMRKDMQKLLKDMPEAVLESVKRKFTDGGLMSKFKVDLLITHICALACLVDNYEVDTWDLQEDLKLEAKEITTYFKEIGARVVAFPESERKKFVPTLDKAAAAQRRFARLKLPLEFPKQGFGRKMR